MHEHLRIVSPPQVVHMYTIMNPPLHNVTTSSCAHIHYHKPPLHNVTTSSCAHVHYWDPIHAAHTSSDALMHLFGDEDTVQVSYNPWWQVGHAIPPMTTYEASQLNGSPASGRSRPTVTVQMPACHLRLIPII